MSMFIVSVQSVCFAHHSAARQCEQAFIALALANGRFIRAISQRIYAERVFTPRSAPRRSVSFNTNCHVIIH